MQATYCIYLSEWEMPSDLPSVGPTPPFYTVAHYIKLILQTNNDSFIMQVTWCSVNNMVLMHVCLKNFKLKNW